MPPSFKSNFKDCSSQILEEQTVEGALVVVPPEKAGLKALLVTVGRGRALRAGNAGDSRKQKKVLRQSCTLALATGLIGTTREATALRKEFHQLNREWSQKQSVRLCHRALLALAITPNMKMN